MYLFITLLIIPLAVYLVCVLVCPKCMCMCVSQVYMEGVGNHHRTCAHVSVSVCGCVQIKK